MSEVPVPGLPITVDDGSPSAIERAAAETAPVKGWLVLDEPGGPRVGLPGRGEPPITVGRDPSCAARAPFDDTHVSRRHAQLGWFSPGWWSVTDLCSSNGTIVGGDRVHDPVPITAGQFLQVGRTVYRIELDEAGSDETVLGGAVLDEVERR